MDPYLTPSGIRFNDYFFSEPTRLREWIPPRYAGLCAILAADPNWAPKPFQPQYFGEFGNNTPPAAWWNEYRPMPGEADPRELFIAVLPMPFSTTAQRLAVRLAAGVGFIRDAEGEGSQYDGSGASDGVHNFADACRLTDIHAEGVARVVGTELHIGLEGGAGAGILRKAAWPNLGHAAVRWGRLDHGRNSDGRCQGFVGGVTPCVRRYRSLCAEADPRESWRYRSYPGELRRGYRRAS